MCSCLVLWLSVHVVWLYVMKRYSACTHVTCYVCVFSAMSVCVYAAVFEPSTIVMYLGWPPV